MIRKIALLALLAPALLAGTARASVPQFYLNHVPLNGVGEAYAVPIKAWGTVRISGYPIGVERCRVHFGGEVWNPELGVYSSNSLLDQAGWIEGIAFYHCRQELAASEPGCHERFGIKADEYSEWPSEVFLEPTPNGWQLQVETWGGVWTLRCGKQSIKLYLNRRLGAEHEWENGTASGSAPSRWRLSGPLSIFVGEARTLQTEWRLRVFGEEGGDLLTLQ